jgi:hypoxanthine phosphoribosyltransferase
MPKILEIVGYFTGIAGLGASIYFGLDNRRLSRLQNRFTWPDIERACRRIGATMRRPRRMPDLVVCFEGPSAIVANLALAIHDLQVPICIICLRSRQTLKPYETENLPEYETLTSTKWVVSIPKQILAFSDKKIWIIEDAIITGDSLRLFMNYLLEKGFKKDNISVSAIVCTDVALSSDKGADDIHYAVDSATFWFPWGKGG